MKLLQINTTVNSGSTGRIAEDIGRVAISHGHESYIAFGRGNRPSSSEKIRIGTSFDVYRHVLKTRLFDRHGFGSTQASRVFIEKIKKINPDIIHLHNIHGYYLNVGVLFGYLKQAGKPVVWTFHDCWPFTGHCSHFERVNCDKWINQCFSCPLTKAYPASLGYDNSRKNYLDKKAIFSGLENLHIVTPSHWLAGHVKNSFLKNYNLHVVNNGIDVNSFVQTNPEQIRQKYNIPNHNIILGVAGTWKKKKALVDFVELSKMLSDKDRIVLVGLSREQIAKLPSGIRAIEHTESISELAALYSAADVFVNPTYSDNFPTTNIEALACGTPVVTYNTGGSPEAVDEHTGAVVEKGDIKGLAEAIKAITDKGKSHYAPLCRDRAVRLYNKDDRFAEYLKIYETIVSQSNE